jgi:hypothetical protein
MRSKRAGFAAFAKPYHVLFVPQLRADAPHPVPFCRRDPAAHSITTADLFQVQGPSAGGIVASRCSAAFGVEYMPFQRCSLPRGSRPTRALRP